METRRAAPFAANLRRELSERNRRWSREQASSHELSYGAMPTVVYPAEEDRHGNFHQASYAAILAQPEWRRRLDKVHTQARTCLPRTGQVWRELDSCNSSDALLMNIFCHPEVLADHEVHTLLGIESAGLAVFGYRARVPLNGGRVDRTEVDMLLRYRDLETVFDVEALPLFGDRIRSYQLIRNVLCAHATGNAFCVLCDQRRPDLIEDWYRIMRCVVLYDLRPRLKLLTWQELSGALPEKLQEFLAGKYGIAAPGKEAPTLMNEEDEPVEDACRAARGSFGRA
jgi:hypothetical protein